MPFCLLQDQKSALPPPPPPMSDGPRPPHGSRRLMEYPICLSEDSKSKPPPPPPHLPDGPKVPKETESLISRANFIMKGPAMPPPPPPHLPDGPRVPKGHRNVTSNLGLYIAQKAKPVPPPPHYPDGPRVPSGPRRFTVMSELSNSSPLRSFYDVQSSLNILRTVPNNRDLYGSRDLTLRSFIPSLSTELKTQILDAKLKVRPFNMAENASQDDTLYHDLTDLLNRSNCYI